MVTVSNWQALNLSGIVPPGFSTIASTLAEVSSAVSAAEQLEATALQLLSTVEQGVGDVTGDVTNAAIAAITNLFQDLLTSAVCYLLPIPVIPPDVVLTGNELFLNEVSGSLQDALDAARPMFNSDMAVAGFVVMYGGPDIGPVLAAIPALLAPLSHVVGSLDGNVVKVPQDLSYILVPPSVTPTSSIFPTKAPTLSGYGVMLTWNLDQISNPSASIANLSNILRKTLILRDTKPIPNHPTTAQLKKLTIQSIPFDGIVNTWVDYPPDPTKTYYYAAAYDQSLVTPTSTTPLTTAPISNQISINMSQQSQPPLGGHGVPPNWVSLPSPLALFPPLQVIINELIGYLAGLSAQTTGLTQATSNKIIFLQGLAAQASATAGLLATDLQEMAAILSNPPIGLYSTMFKGVGGTAGFVNALQAAFALPGAPPFNVPLTATGGFVVITGAPSAADLLPFTTLVNLLVGAPESNPTLTAIDTINIVTQSAIIAVQTQLNLDGSLPTTVDTAIGNFGPDLKPGQLC